VRTRLIPLTEQEKAEIQRLLAVQRRLSDADGPAKAVGSETWQAFERIARAHGIDPAAVADLRIDFRAGGGIEARFELRPEPRV
jgi:transposase-like protein